MADVAGPIRVDVAEKGRRRDVGWVGMTKAILWIGAHRWWSWYIWELRTWCGMPILFESVIAGMLQISEDLTIMVAVNPSWVVAEMAQLDHGEAEVGTAGHHGPDQFTDGLAVREAHRAFKVLAFGVGRRDWRSIEMPEGVGGTVYRYRVADAGTSRVTDPCVGS
jgi:hypothetical protein